MKRTFKKTFILIGMTTILFSSCKNALDLNPISTLSEVSYWKTPDQFDAFVNGVHARFREHSSNFEYLGDVRADVFGTDPGNTATFTGEATQGFERMWLHTLDVDNAGVNNFGGFYDNINQLNFLIQKLNTTSVVTEANKKKYLGIAYGMRAFYYFQLYRTWGNVVIRTEPTTGIDVADLAKPASSQAEVMELIKADIQNSNDNFGADYSFSSPAKRGFWSKAATQMLKAEVYLWTSYRGGGNGDATTAKASLTEIQSNVAGLTLLPDFGDVFAAANKDNNEIILSCRNRLNEASMDKPTASTFGFISNFVPQTSLIVNFYDSLANRKFEVAIENYNGLLRVPTKITTYQEFSPLDLRRNKSIQAAYNRSSTGTYTIAGAFLKKYQGEQNAGSRTYTNDYIIYRYADLLLLLAEAKLALGESPATELNLVRTRAYGANYNAATLGYPNQAVDADPKEAILKERFFEFIGEGKRWYDLRRMGDNYVYAHTILTPAVAYKLLWPINRSALTNNRGLTQTEGYPAF